MELLENLNPEQRRAVTHEEGPLLIVAGAGTGKTMVITQRLAWLIEQGRAKSEEILALTFTDKAAGEMEERVDRLLPLGYLDLWVSTFHSFGERLLKNHALEIGLPDDFKLLTQTKQWLLVRENLEKFNLDYYRPLGDPTRFIHALIKHFSRAKDEDVSPEEYLEYAQGLKFNSDSTEFILGKKRTSKKLSREEKEELTSEIKRIEEVAEAYHIYQQLLLQNNALDFGDLINYTLKLFRERPKILAQYRAQFKYILVDEFQDTNWAQYELIKMLAALKNNLTVCADDDQSVFKFRGASVSNVITFKKDYPQSEQVFLSKNYRNKQNILDLSYNFIQLNNPNRLEYQLAKNGKSKLSKKLAAQSEGQGVIEHLSFKTLTQETRGVIEKIIELKNQAEKISWGDFAILVRANDTATPFIVALERAGIPYQFLASRGLYTKPVVMDIISYLKLLDDYHESSALYRILVMPPLDFPAQEIPRLTYLARQKNWSLYEVLKRYQGQVRLSEESEKKIMKLIGMIEKHTQLTKEHGVGEVIMSFLEDAGYLKHLSWISEQGETEPINYLNQFYKEVAQFEERTLDKSVKVFMEELNCILASGERGSLTLDWEEGPEAVRIMTIHGAKGLEFPYCFIVSLVDKRFPTIERPEPIELPEKLIKEIIPEGDIHIEEERRLFYVAMTRAKQGLYFTTAQDYGGARKKKPSRFLVELSLTEVEQKSFKKDFTKKLGPVSAQVKPRNYLPRRFSFTQLKAFSVCPYQYRLAHILRIPTRGKAVFSFGKTIHNTLYHFFRLARERSGLAQTDLFGQTNTSSRKKVKDLISAKELLELYQKAWIEDWFESKSQQKEYLKKGREILKNFYETLPADQPLPKYLEKGFNLKIGEHTFGGVIDRVDEIAPGEIEIVDYKTGRPSWAEKLTIEDKEQLLIYQMAAEQVFPEKPIMLTFYYVGNNSKASFLGSAEELTDLKQKIMKQIAAIKESQFEATPSHMCRYCDFQEICEFRQ